MEEGWIQVRGLRSARNDKSDCCPWQEEPNGDVIKTKPLGYWSVSGAILFGGWRGLEIGLHHWYE